MKKNRGLRRRWILNTVSVVGILGILCSLAITAIFAGYLYADTRTEMTQRAEATADLFADCLYEDYNAYYASCVTYIKTFAQPNAEEMQFLDGDGRLMASSYGDWVGHAPQTPEILRAQTDRKSAGFVGDDPSTGARILAVSAPLIYRDGELAGVIRYVTPTKTMDVQIVIMALASLLGFMLVTGAVVLCSNHQIRSVLQPVREITDKAKRIAGGTYGIQIKTKYNDELGELADTINDLSNQISQNEKTQTEFISSLSHELRTPLTAITGWSETLIDSENLDEDTSRGMRIIQREAKRLTEMVVDLLDFTRIQDGKMTLNVEPTDIRGEFEDTVYMYGSRLSQDGIRLEYQDTDEDIPEIACDPKRMRQVFLNLLDNAAKHGGEGKEIQASLGMREGNIVIHIRDYGPGIAEDEIPLVKKKFYKGSSKARGSGIGLAICDEIVQMHGGELILENAEGGGTLVSIILPAAQ